MPKQVDAGSELLRGSRISREKVIINLQFDVYVSRRP